MTHGQFVSSDSINVIPISGLTLFWASIGSFPYHYSALATTRCASQEVNMTVAIVNSPATRITHLAE